MWRPGANGCNGSNTRVGTANMWTFSLTGYKIAHVSWKMWSYFSVKHPFRLFLYGGRGDLSEYIPIKWAMTTTYYND